MVEALKKELFMEFDKAVARVEKIIVEHGFTHMFTKQIDDIFKQKLGIENYPRYTVILACGASFAKAALDASRDAGLLFPCSFVVYEEEGRIYTAHISIMKVAVAVGLAPADKMVPVIEETGAAVHEIWEKL